MKDCPYCGSDNKEKARYCNRCGKPLWDTFKLKDQFSVLPSLEKLKQGTTLKGRFRIIKLINVGGMGYIYHSFDELLKKDIAIKEMIDRFTDPQERTQAIERFRRESEMLCQLDHPAIPGFLEHFVENQRFYLVMEYIPGMDLRRLLAKLKDTGKKLPMERVIQWAIEICDVLDYLHSRTPPIIHRDLKPSNIIITPQHNVRLLDFGIARLFVPKVKSTMVGTQGYAPPEQYRGEAEIRSDLYALGATMHHLLSGKDPQYEAPFHFDPLRKIDPDVPVALESIVEKSLKLTPSDRFQSAKHFKLALAELVLIESKFTDLAREIKQLQEEISELKKRKTRILDPDGKLKEPETVEDKKKDRKIIFEKAWMQYRCNKYRSGLSSVPANLQGHLKWRYNTNGNISASPVVDTNGNVFVGSQDGRLFSLDQSGNIRWIFNSKGNIISAAAINHEDNVFVAVEGGILYAIDPEGMKRWHYNTTGPIFSAPLISNSRIYIATYDGWLHCLNFDGELDWKFDVEETVSLSPAAGYDGTIFLIGGKGSIKAVDVDGKMKWKAVLPSLISTSPAVSAEETIYVGCEDNVLYALDLSGKIGWHFKTRSEIQPSLAISKDQTVFVGSGDRHLYAIDKNGQEKWIFDAGDSIITSPAITDEGSIYFSTKNGILFAVHPYGKSRWWLNLNSTVLSSPAISPDAMLYIGSYNGHIYAIT